jgi:hypothetical protein
MLNGYTGVMAYLPARKLSIAVAATTGARAAASEKAYATLLFSRIAAHLSPNQQPNIPGTAQADR